MECLRFEDWMRQALHDPQRGYYASRVRTVGRAGDFSTSTTAGSVLAEAIARWLCSELRSDPATRTVIEVGGGDGSLSSAVRRTLGWWRRRALDWLMVEISPRLRELQQVRLGRGRVRWFESMSAALQDCGGRALIFHNELVDAFPVRLLQWNASQDRWDEVWLCCDGGTWREQIHPAEMDDREMHDHAALSSARWQSVPLRDGQRIELQTACHRWLCEWSPSWQAGAMLTVDYGDAFPGLYHRQPRGTVRAYLRQQRLTGVDVYANMGRQDITSDVNFTDLTAWSARLGWESEALMTQRQFLNRHVPRLDARCSADAATAFLSDESGAGSAFKVLVQRVRKQAGNRLRVPGRDGSTHPSLPDRHE